MAHKDGVFLIQFVNAKDHEMVVNGGPYYMNKHPIVMKNWTLDFDFHSKSSELIFHLGSTTQSSPPILEKRFS